MLSLKGEGDLWSVLVTGASWHVGGSPIFRKHLKVNLESYKLVRLASAPGDFCTDEGEGGWAQSVLFNHGEMVPDWPGCLR